ncbi:hypothetical protein GKQ23_07600 [Erwinia sp. E602]|uniref:hypothetical protein n=1 Tax=unclassified Erwinia TaxID=2622719 RepID=UPI0006FD42E7|nr:MULTISPECIES: hypothetical protein [unclassified Erwinia]KQN54985.1 hypothetical protein ASF13_11180 [Erwinia sp. Leaf53]PLV63307.1 hypothetical protein NV64_01915 [Erwinia sp. B116]QUG74864.1 hypothetical protein GKQ23_07600 [Erwinia sp. E602]
MSQRFLRGKGAFVVKIINLLCLQAKTAAGWRILFMQLRHKGGLALRIRPAVIEYVPLKAGPVSALPQAKAFA